LFFFEEIEVNDAGMKPDGKAFKFRKIQKFHLATDLVFNHPLLEFL